MTKVRDIANFLGKTEAFNTTNKTLAFDSSDVTIITPEVVSTLAGVGGTVVYDSVGLLPTNPSDGDRAWVTGNNRFYVADSSWHNSLLVNVPPTINIANYDGVLTDSQSLTMTIQVTDSFENLDIISFNAVLSPPNITDSAVATFSRDSSVIAIAMSPAATNDATSFTITFSANDQVNLSTSVKSFTIDRGFVLEPLSQILSLSGSTIINADSDLAGGAFQLTSGDTLSDSAPSIEATVASAIFLDNTQQSRTSAGNTMGIDVGAGKVAIPTGAIDSSYIGWIWSGTSSETTTASRFRTGDAAGGQIISHLSVQPSTWISNDANLSSMYIHGIVDGNTYRNYAGVICTQYSLTTNGGATRKGTQPIYATSYTGYSAYSNGIDGGGNPNYVLMKSDTYSNGVSGFYYNWPIPSYTSNWSYRNVTWKACSASTFDPGWGSNFQFTIVLSGNQQSNFPVGGKIHIGTDSTVNGPTAQEVYEGQHFTILGTHVATYNISGAYYFNKNHSSYADTPGADIWADGDLSGGRIYSRCGVSTGDTVVVCAGGMGYTQNQAWGSSIPSGSSRDALSTNIPIYVRSASLCNQVYIISEDYPRYGVSGDNDYLENTDLYPSYSEWSSTSNASGASNGTSTYPIYKQSGSEYTQLELDPSPAGDGTEVSIGTSVLGSYVWKNGTKITVDDNTGFTAGKFVQKKT